MPAVKTVRVGALLRFVNPPDKYHSESLYRLLLVAEHGPLRDGGIAGGAGGCRPLSDYELRQLVEAYRRRVGALLEQLRVRGDVQGFRHPLSHEVLEMLRAFMPRLRKAHQDYSHIDLQTQLIFDDFSCMVEDFEEELVMYCTRLPKL